MTKEIYICIIIVISVICAHFACTNYTKNSTFELENILPKFMKCLSENELKQIFEVLINLIDSNDNNLRKATKNLLNEYTKLNIITFNKYK